MTQAKVSGSSSGVLTVNGAPYLLAVSYTHLDVYKRQGMNRSTVYYHFESREALLASVKQWVGMRLSDALLGVGLSLIHI